MKAKFTRLATATGLGIVVGVAFKGMQGFATLLLSVTP